MAYHEASVPISPVPQVSTRVQLARSLGTFVSLFSQARGLRHQSSSWCARFSRAQTTMPHPTLHEGLGVSLGSPLPTSHSPSHPPRSLPCSTWKTQTERDRWRVHLLAPSALCGSPAFGQRVEQVDLCHLWHRFRWTGVPTRSARVCFLARLADSIDKVCQGQRSTEGLYHASGDSPYRSSAKPPPLAGLSPAHGAFQEHAAHIIEWSMMLSSNGSLGGCTHKGLSHSSMPLARRTERTLLAVACTPWFGHALGCDHLHGWAVLPASFSPAVAPQRHAAWHGI